MALAILLDRLGLKPVSSAISNPRPEGCVAEPLVVSFRTPSKTDKLREKSFLNKSERFLSRGLLRNDNLLVVQQTLKVVAINSVNSP